MGDILALAGLIVPILVFLVASTASVAFDVNPDETSRIEVLRAGGAYMNCANSGRGTLVGVGVDEQSPCVLVRGRQVFDIQAQPPMDPQSSNWRQQAAMFIWPDSVAQTLSGREVRIEMRLRCIECAPGSLQGLFITRGRGHSGWFDLAAGDAFETVSVVYDYPDMNTANPAGPSLILHLDQSASPNGRVQIAHLLVTEN